MKPHFEIFTEHNYTDIPKDVWVNMNLVDVIRKHETGGTALCLAGTEEGYILVEDTIEEMIARGIINSREPA